MTPVHGEVEARDDAGAVASAVIAKMQTAWNDHGDVGLSMFADDIDFINAFGPHWRGIDAVANGTANIKATFKSKANYRLAHAAEIAPGIVLAILNATVTIPEGQPMAGVHPTTQSILLVQRAGDWKIRFLQTTPVAGLPGAMQ